MSDQSTAIAVKSRKTDLVSIAGRGTVERYDKQITLPVDYQYGIPKYNKVGVYPDGKPKFEKVIEKVGITAAGYEFMNMVIGARFFLPQLVPDRNGKMVANPIVEPPDYTRLMLGCAWYNPSGQHMVSYEMVEVDFWLMYQEARAGKNSAKMEVDPETFQPMFDARGLARLVLSEADELACYKELAQRRSLGPRYAQTVARVRLLKQATGRRELEASPDKQLHPVSLTLTGFRDPLDANEATRVDRDTEVSLYGAAMLADNPSVRLTAGEMAEAGLNDENDDAAVIEGLELAAMERDKQDHAAPVEAQAKAASTTCDNAGTEVAAGEVCGLAAGHGGVMHKSMTSSWPMAKP